MSLISTISNAISKFFVQEEDQPPDFAVLDQGQVPNCTTCAVAPILASKITGALKKKYNNWCIKITAELLINIINQMTELLPAYIVDIVYCCPIFRLQWPSRDEGGAYVGFRWTVHLISGEYKKYATSCPLVGELKKLALPKQTREHTVIIIGVTDTGDAIVQNSWGDLLPFYVLDFNAFSSVYWIEITHITVDANHSMERYSIPFITNHRRFRPLNYRIKVLLSDLEVFACNWKTDELPQSDIQCLCERDYMNVFREINISFTKKLVILGALLRSLCFFYIPTVNAQLEYSATFIKRNLRHCYDTTCALVAKGKSTETIVAMIKLMNTGKDLRTWNKDTISQLNAITPLWVGNRSNREKMRNAAKVFIERRAQIVQHSKTTKTERQAAQCSLISSTICGYLPIQHTPKSKHHGFQRGGIDSNQCKTQRKQQREQYRNQQRQHSLQKNYKSALLRLSDI